MESTGTTVEGISAANDASAGTPHALKTEMNSSAGNHTLDEVSKSINNGSPKRICYPRNRTVDTSAKNPGAVIHQEDGTLHERLLENGTGVVETPEPFEQVMEPLTMEERKLFRGFVELESEPALFEHILHKNGVEGVKIREQYDVFDFHIDDNKSKIHGLIFLSPYGITSNAEEELDVPSCPKHVWFANQVVDNACASVAVLNIIMNCPDIELGEDLLRFRQRTMKMKPPYRGREIGESSFIRENHNTFMRRMEMLNADLVVSNNHEKYEKGRGTKKGASGARRVNIAHKHLPGQTKQRGHVEEAYHYVGYVPIGQDVWRLDGLMKHPTNIGPRGTNWLSVARADMAVRIAQDNTHQYNLMAICEDPLRMVRASLAQIVQDIDYLENILDNVVEDWKVFVDFDLGTPRDEMLSSYLLTQAMIEARKDNAGPLMAHDDKSPFSLLSARKILSLNQAKLEEEYIREVGNVAEDSEIISRRLHELTPTIVRSLHELSADAVLKAIVQKIANERVAEE